MTRERDDDDPRCELGEHMLGELDDCPECEQYRRFMVAVSDMRSKMFFAILDANGLR